MTPLIGRMIAIFVAATVMMESLADNVAAQMTTATPPPPQPTLADRISVLEAHAFFFDDDSATQRQQTPPDLYVLLDVRTEPEFVDFHATGAVWLPLSEITVQAVEVLGGDKSIGVVVICRSGNRSQVARDLLIAQGYTRATSVDGGTVEWRDAGFPVVSGSDPLPRSVSVSRAFHMFYANLGTRTDQSHDHERKLFADQVDASGTTATTMTTASTPQAVVVPRYVLLDVRSESEWLAGHAAPAEWLPLTDIVAASASGAAPVTLADGSAVGGGDKHASIAVICSSGVRSARARDLLHLQGFTDVTSVVGGTDEWIAAGFPTLTGDVTENSTAAAELSSAVRVGVGGSWYVSAFCWALMTATVLCVCQDGF